MKKTKEQLSKELAIAESQLSELHKADSERRTRFSELLDSYEWQDTRFGISREKKVITLSWLEISFKMGELKADADYQMCLEREKRLREELSSAELRIQELLNEKKS